MQLLDDGDIQLLGGEQQCDVAPAQGRRNRGVEKRLLQGPLDESERLDRRLSGAVAALCAQRRDQHYPRHRDRTKDETLAGGLFECGLRLLDMRIFLQGARECFVQGQAARGGYTNEPNRKSDNYARLHWV